jgi:hypothetical protein
VVIGSLVSGYCTECGGDIDESFAGRRELGSARHSPSPLLILLHSSGSSTTAFFFFSSQSIVIINNNNVGFVVGRCRRQEMKQSGLKVRPPKPNVYDDMMDRALMKV